MNELNHIGSRLSQFRKSKKLSGEELGDILGGIKKGTVSQIENGKSNLTIPAISNLVEQYPDLNLNWLFNGEGEMLAESSAQQISPGTCWKELEKEKARYESLMNDYREMQETLKALEQRL